MKKLKSLLQIKEEKTFFYGTRENTEEGLVNFKLNYTDDINEVRKSLEKFLIENHNFLLSNGVSLSPKAYKKQTIILRGNKTTFEISYEAYKYFKEKLLTILDEIKKKAIEDYGINTDSIIRMSLYTSGVSLKKEKEGKNEKTKIETLYFCCANQLDINLLYDVLEEKLNAFIKYLLQKVVLVVITTNTFESAFRLFNVINSRGLPLTNSDLLKSENLRVINIERRKDFTEIWENDEIAYKFFNSIFT